MTTEAATSDVVNAHVATLCEPGGHLLTSDADDLELLLDTLQTTVTIGQV